MAARASTAPRARSPDRPGLRAGRRPFTPLPRASHGYVRSRSTSPRPDTGWVAGVAYEIPEIALRVALTYNSAITFDSNDARRCPAHGRRSHDLRSTRGGHTAAQSVNSTARPASPGHAAVRLGPLGGMERFRVIRPTSSRLAATASSTRGHDDLRLGLGRRFTDLRTGPHLSPTRRRRTRRSRLAAGARPTGYGCRHRRRPTRRPRWSARGGVRYTVPRRRQARDRSPDTRAPSSVRQLDASASGLKRL